MVLGLASISVCVAQQRTEWVTYEDSGKNISFQAPENVLINKDKDHLTLYAFSNGAHFSVTQTKIEDPKRAVKGISLTGPKGTTTQTYKFGDYLVRRLDSRTKNGIETKLYAGSSNAYFYIATAARNEENPAISKFLKSIKLGGAHLLPTSDLPLTTNKKASILDELQVSSEVRVALNRPDNTTSKIKFEEIKDELSVNYDSFSRFLIILSKPRPGYTDVARMNQVQGTIRANVEFLKSGDIGNIIVDRRLGSGLPQNVATAIKGIKFIAAEINGKSVDVTVTMEYKFTIY